MFGRSHSDAGKVAMEIFGTGMVWFSHEKKKVIDCDRVRQSKSIFHDCDNLGDTPSVVSTKGVGE